MSQLLYFYEWIGVMAQELGHLIRCSHCEIMWKNLANSFKPTYLKTTCIIDCLKSLLKEQHFFLPKVRHTQLQESQHCKVFSRNQSHRSCYCMFISKWWGGCASDKYKTICNGFLDHPFNSDVVWWLIVSLTLQKIWQFKEPHFAYHCLLKANYKFPIGK